jgi:DNA polymerase-3 subunit alpha
MYCSRIILMRMGSKKIPDLTSADYVHLHNHTQYSLLDGLTKVPALINYVKEQGMVAVAMTDHGTLSGVIDFYKEATNNEIKPVIGMETYIAKRRHIDKEAGKDKQNYHLILLAMNRIGYQNLMRLSTIANLDGFYYKPRIDHQLLEKYNEGLIVLSGCIGGEVGDAIRSGDYEQATEIAGWYKKIFGDRYYLEVQDHGHPEHPSKWDEQVAVNEKLLEMSKSLQIPAVVTCDAHYLKHSDQEAHEVLLCVQTSSFMADEKRMSLANFELHVTEPEEIIKRWGSTNPELILNSRAIADRCQVDIDLGKILIPSFEVPKGETEKSYLHKLVWRGLAFRYCGVPEKDSLKMTEKQVRVLIDKDIAERADYELGVIENMGFNGYFLIIHDFISWGKQQGIVFGPGRGSAAGSIIAYSLRITELDPLEYDLLFERFLNPDRISMPDVDIDIQDSRRDEVIQYCVAKYGTERVANIVTFGRMAARNAVRDVARVLQVPYGDSDRLAKMIPPPVQGRHIPLEKSLVENSELKAEYKNNPVARRVFDLAVQMEGTIRSHGVHAAGVVIAPDDLVKFAPLEMAQKGVVSTQYPMGPVEELGLLKMDFLGLSNLTTIKNTLRIIKKVLNKDIDINSIPLDDDLTFELLQRGDTTGVFQFESSGMKRYLKDLKPTEFGDVVAMGALYRPGPLSAGLTDSFIKRKNGLESVTYDHPTMKPALESTYGVLVYQEQFMQISRDVCGFTGGEADTLRKAIGKKKLDMMLKMEERFIEGAVSNGVSRALIEGFWQKLVGFADYCFNKSHSACYGLISYQTAYLKAHYPAPFMAALMTGDFDDTDRLSIEITECKHMGIEVLPPDINESFTDFAVTPDLKAIRFGMHAIKNVGGGVVDDIIAARDQEGQFVDLEDFLKRVPSKTVNKKTMESLIKAGAFDRFDDRSTLLHNVELITAYSSKIHKDAASGQTDLFGNTADDAAGTKIQLSLASPAVVHTQHERLVWERELLGLYLSQHPLKAYGTFLAEHTTPLNLLKPDHDNKQVSVGGAVIDVREITTKKGQKMAFVKIGDQMGEVELVLFPGAFQQTIGIWDRDKVVLVKGKVNARDRDGNVSEDIKILVDDAREVTPDQADAYQGTGKKTPVPKAAKKLLKKTATSKSEQPPTPPRLYLRMKDTSNQEILQKIKQSLDKYPGPTEAVLVLGSQKQIIRLPLTIEPHVDLLEVLAELLGAESVVVK